MSRLATRWYSKRVGREVQVVRWGETGVPVIFFPTAAGDAEEVERFLMVDALAPLLEAGRIKLYSVDSVPGQVWLKENNQPPVATAAQRGFDGFVADELVPAIYEDCGGEPLEIIATGASIGAYNALASICRHPDLFREAYCLSGTYELSKFLDGDMDEAWYYSSPLHFVPNLPADHADLASLRERFVILAHGTGRWEDPKESWDVAKVLGAQGIPNRVDEWGDEWDHDWPTWRRMLPQFLEERLPALEAAADEAAKQKVVPAAAAKAAAAKAPAKPAAKAPAKPAAKAPAKPAANAPAKSAAEASAKPAAKADAKPAAKAPAKSKAKAKKKPRRAKKS